MARDSEASKLAGGVRRRVKEISAADKNRGSSVPDEENKSKLTSKSQFIENELSSDLTRKGDDLSSKCYAETLTNPIGVLSSGLSPFQELLFSCICVVCGTIVLVLVCFRYSTYVNQLHENQMWFSHITEVEREISFRTESGLYYSYYKHLLAASSLQQGILDLTRDNITEHPSTINVLARMNIYQEVLLAAIYRCFSGLQVQMEPVYFYIDTVFALHGLLVASLFAISWLLSGTWLSGLLAALFYIFNRPDVTRVEQWIPLRENFSLPFLWTQIAVLTLYFRRNLSPNVERLCRSALLVFTFLFSITWQFNQFALLLQAMALFGVQVLNLVDRKKILFVYWSQGVAMFAVYVLQFFNPMVISGMLFSFLVASIAVMKLESLFIQQCAGSIFWNFLRTILSIFAVFLLTLLFSLVVKSVIRQEADEHIYKFVLTKLGISDPSRDFDVRLYLCNGAFEFLDFGTFERMSSRLVFPLYALAHAALLGMLAVTTINKWTCVEGEKESTHSSYLASKPELAYHIVQAVFFGAVGLMALRMKFFWTPYMCIIASSSLGNIDFWRWLLGQIRCSSTILSILLRYAVLVSTVSALLYVRLPPTLRELENLQEFYDPDTVELMQWINTNTQQTESFAGSMQLLAGVKLCTGRPITNHPHYEDKSLRLRTRELYKMYGRQSPEEVFEIMKKYSVNYVILEDSHCLAPSRAGCRLPDIVDVDSGMVTDDGSTAIGLVVSNTPRFCDEVRHGSLAYSKYFSLVMKNRTFRVYKVIAK